MVIKKHIAVICDYELLENRVGGMDYFFWKFNEKCEEKNIKIDWFFPNKATHGDYHKLNIFTKENRSIEASFINHIKTNTTDYSYIVTHFLELCTSFYAEVKKQLNTHVIAVDHNPRPLKGYSLTKKIKKIIKGILYAKYINQFIGVSDHTSNEILKDFGFFLKSKTKTINNGLEFSTYQKKHTFLSTSKFITSSHLREEKGIQDLIKAITILPKSLSNKISLDIYGDGPYKENLIRMVASNNLEHIVNFKGSVMNLNKLYKNYDYLIHPSRGETFCYSVLEATVCNLPVITTKKNGNILGLIKEEKNGFIYNEEDEKMLSNILEHVLSGNKIISNVSNSTLVNKFSLDSMVNNHINLLKF